MIHLNRLIVLIVILVSGFSTANAGEESKVLMYVAEGSEDLELTIPQSTNHVKIGNIIGLVDNIF